MRRSRVGKTFRWIVIAVALVWSLGPIALGIVTSLSTQAEVQAGQWIPRVVNVSGYQALLTGGGVETTTGFVPSEVAAFGHAMRNSLAITIEATAVLLVFAVTAGYAFSRLKFQGSMIVCGCIRYLPSVVRKKPGLRPQCATA